MSADRASARVQRSAVQTAHIHRARENVHDDITAAEDGDSQEDINDRVSQRLSVGQKRFCGGTLTGEGGVRTLFHIRRRQ